jgi:opacity protein-like surface antigen
MSKKVSQITRLSTLAITALASGASLAEGPNVWDGPYMGANIGGATNRGCSRWLLPGTGVDLMDQMTNQACASSGLVGGAQVGENFQYQRVFWGLAADINFATANKTTRSLASTGTSLPAGTYSTSERLSPDGFLILAPLIGYAGREFAPYVKAGGLVAFGGQDSSITYKPSGAAQPTASFDGAKSFNTIGWVAGGGMEWGLYGPWSIGFEYMHASLGKALSASAGCAVTAATCESFSGISLENSHTALTLNMFRVAVNYYFDYW